MYKILLKLFQRHWSRNESCLHTPSIVLRNIAFRVALLIFIAKAKNRATTGIRSIDISNEFLVDPSPFPLRRVFDGTPPSRGEGRGAERPVAGSRNYGALLQLCRVTEFLQACEQPKRKSLVSPPSSLNRGRPNPRVLVRVSRHVRPLPDTWGSLAGASNSRRAESLGFVSPETNCLLSWFWNRIIIIIVDGIAFLISKNFLPRSRGRGSV